MEVELRYTNHFIYWLLDGTVVAQRTNTSAFRSGNLMVGLMDTFSSIANPAADAFVLFDNVRVEELSERVRFLSVKPGAGGLHLLVSGVPGNSYWLEFSSNLAGWYPLALLTSTNGPMGFIDPGLNESRFYRVRQ